MTTTGWFRGPAIGSGVTATVSIATSINSGDIFAVKSTDLSRSDLLQREHTILSSFKSPYILSCLGSNISHGSSGGLLYNLFLEYAAAGSLSEEIKRSGGRLTEDQTRFRTREIVSGIADLHRAGIIHCDLKPDNVLIGSNGCAKIGDLGCARLIDSEEKGLIIRGSPMYMSPEAVRAEDQGMPADVWALGCVVIEMATGRAPWPEATNVAEGIRRIGFSGEVPAIPDWFSDDAKEFVSNCLRRNPDERWTADELLCHPYIGVSKDCGGDLSNWVSPKSTLDLGFWESMEEEEEEEVEDEYCDDVEAAMTRIHELAETSAGHDWCWDGEWVDVIRNVAGETSPEAVVVEFDGVEAAVDGDELVGDDVMSRSVWNESCDCEILREEMNYNEMCRCKLRFVEFSDINSNDRNIVGDCY